MIPRHRGVRIASRKWSPEIILALAGGRCRFSRLLQIPGISDVMLFRRLVELIDAGLVERDVDPGPPVHVWYRLTDAAQPYLEPLRQLARAEELARGVPIQEVAI